MATEVQSFVWKLLQLCSDDIHADLNISCKNRKISMNMHLELDEVSLPVINKPLYNTKNYQNSYKPSRLRRRKKRELSRQTKFQEDTFASALNTSIDPSSEYVAGNEDIDVESIDSLQGPVLEFDTARPDLFKANGPIEFSFGSLPPRTEYMEYMDNTSNCDIDVFAPDLPLPKDVLNQDSYTTNDIYLSSQMMMLKTFPIVPRTFSQLPILKE